MHFILFCEGEGVGGLPHEVSFLKNEKTNWKASSEDYLQDERKAGGVMYTIKQHYDNDGLND